MGKRHKNTEFEFKSGWILGIIILFGVALIISRSIIPQVIGSIIRCVLIDGVIIWLIFSKTFENTLLEKITVILYGILYTLFSFVQIPKVALGAYIVYSFFNVGVSIYSYYKNKQSAFGVWIFACLSAITITKIVFGLEYVGSDLHFWLPSLIVAIVIFVISLIVVLKIYFSKKAEGDLTPEYRNNLISIPIAGILFGFCVALMCISSFNYIFDFSQPIKQTYTVIEKEVVGGVGVPYTSTLFLKDGNNEVKISVGNDVYEKYEIGGEIVISLYQGAFNVPYYVYEE